MPTAKPNRIVLVLPCCIGDVIMATAALVALRRAYPDAHIAWAVGSWSKAAIQRHPNLNAVLDTGAEAHPYKTPIGMTRFVRLLRAGRYDLLVSFVRSPLMSIAALMTGIPVRAGLDSAGRGFGYTLRVTVDPDVPRHEAELYLDVVRTLGVDTAGCYANVPPLDADRAVVRQRLTAAGISGRYLVVHPGGGRNPGMTLDAKRYPPDKLAALVNRMSLQLGVEGVVIGAPGDQPLVDAVTAGLAIHHAAFTDLSFGQIAALASDSALYLGNDTGMTHLAAAAGAKAGAIFGPTDPRRYAPFAPYVLALWRPSDVGLRGVAGGEQTAWDWDRDGITVDEAERKIKVWLASVHEQ